MKKIKTKIEKILESNTDEREILENGKLFQKALDKIIYITDWAYTLSIIIGTIILIVLEHINTQLGIQNTYMGKIFFAIIAGESLICFIIDLITFIYIRKTLDKNTFGGTINKKTYLYSLHFIMHIIYIIVGIMVILGIKLYDLIFLLGTIAYPVIIILINIYFTHKYKKKN